MEPALIERPALFEGLPLRLIEVRELAEKLRKALSHRISLRSGAVVASDSLKVQVYDLTSVSRTN